MPVYEYAGLDSSGKTLKGILDADSTVAARQKLRASGVFPVEVKETLSRPKGGPSDALSLFAFFQRVKPGEVYAITRQLSTLLGAGVPLVASLDSLISQKSSPLLKKIIAQIKESVNQGCLLYTSPSPRDRTRSRMPSSA